MRAVLASIIVVIAGFAVGTAYFERAHRQSVAHDAAALTGGDPRRGRDCIRRYGCIACHDIPGFAGTRSHVGPPLEAYSLRMYVAGAVENKPDNLVRFLRNPRAVLPPGAMPDLGVTDPDARDIAAYLYTLE